MACCCYSPAIRLRAGDVAEDLATVATGCWLSCAAAWPRIGFVMTIERGGEQVAWFGKDLRANEHEPGKWERFNAEFLLRETKVLPGDSIIYYIWNRDRDPLFVDDLDLFFHSANVPGRPLGAAVHVDSLTSKDMPLPFAPCTCEPFQLLERSRRKIIGEPVDSLGQPLDSARVARGFTWYRTSVMPLAELRDADGKRIAWVRPFCASLGIDRAEVLAALDEAAVKERLKAEVDAAIARGVFGSPYIVIDGEPFWGSDRLEQVDRWLATGGW